MDPGHVSVQPFRPNPLTRPPAGSRWAEGMLSSVIAGKEIATPGILPECSAEDGGTNVLPGGGRYQAPVLPGGGRYQAPV